MPNEDAFDKHVWADGAAVAVADGVGSVSRASVGAQAAAAAALLVAGAWVEGSVRSEQVPALINKQWQVLLAVPAQDAASTVCLVAVRQDGSWLATSLGDSIFHVVSVHGQTTTPNDGHFADTTHALSERFDSSEWVLVQGREDDRLNAALVMTDGIGHDVDIARLPGLIDTVAGASREHGPDQASSQLVASLQQWGTPSHTDDKTIACLVVDWSGDA